MSESDDEASKRGMSESVRHMIYVGMSVWKSAGCWREINNVVEIVMYARQKQAWMEIKEKQRTIGTETVEGRR